MPSAFLSLPSDWDRRPVPSGTALVSPFKWLYLSVGDSCRLRQPSNQKWKGSRVVETIAVKLDRWFLSFYLQIGARPYVQPSSYSLALHLMVEGTGLQTPTENGKVSISLLPSCFLPHTPFPSSSVPDMEGNKTKQKPTPNQKPALHSPPHSFCNRARSFAGGHVGGQCEQCGLLFDGLASKYSNPGACSAGRCMGPSPASL